MRGDPTDDASSVTTVLLVEDDSGDAVLVKELLSPEADLFDVVWVSTLAEAVGAIGPETDCVLLDLGLPDTEGLDALRAITTLGDRPAVVVLTGIDDRVTGARAVALGAQDYLSKASVDEQSLARSIRYAIARQRAEDAARRLRDAELLQAERARLERGLLPRPLLANPALEWTTRYLTGGRRALLGGDFFDAVELADGTVRFVIGDVSGHGPDEAALGVALRVAWRALVLAGLSPDSTLASVERVLEAERSGADTFATVCDIELRPDLRSALIRTAGHPNPVLFDGATVVDVRLPGRRPPLGATGDCACPVNSVDLGPEWTLLVYTDGIIEGYADGRPGINRLGTEGLIDIVADATAQATTLEAVAERVLAGAETANGSPLHDDVALLVLSNSPRWTG